MERTQNIREFLGVKLRRVLRPLTSALAESRVSPNTITVMAAALNLAAAGFVFGGHMIAAGVVFVVGGCLDMVDGAVARAAGRVTPFGAFLDSTLDRVSEGVVLAAIAYRFAVQGRPVDVALVVVALLGSLLVSYTRARAEALGVECKAGIMSRPERVVLLAVGLFFEVLLPYVIYVLAALSMVTVAQRAVHTYKALRAR